MPKSMKNRSKDKGTKIEESMRELGESKVHSMLLEYRLRSAPHEVHRASIRAILAISLSLGH